MNLIQAEALNLPPSSPPPGLPRDSSALATAVRRVLRTSAPFSVNPALLNAAVSRIVSALAPSTVSSYGVGPRMYLEFASAHGLDAAMPPTKATLLAFVVYRADFRMSSHGSIRGYLAGLKFLCRSLGLTTDAFDNAQLELAMRSVKRDRGAKPRPPRLPITIWILQRIRALLDLTDPSQEALWAVLTVAVYGLFRAGELVTKKDNAPCLRRAVVWFSDRVEIRLEASKTDVFRHGVTIRVYKNDSTTCAFSALRVHWDHAFDQSPDAPLFQLANGSGVSYTLLHSSLKLLMLRLGADPSLVGTHSLRIGGASTLAILGFPAHVIQAMGRWKSLSYQLYTRLPLDLARRCARAMGDAAPGSSWFGSLAPAQAVSVSLDNIQAAFRLS